jgi:hypothetical protein
MDSTIPSHRVQPDVVHGDFPTTSTVTTMTTTTITSAATDDGIAAQPALRAAPAQAGRLLGMADGMRTRPNAQLIEKYVDDLLEAFDRGETDADTIMQAATVVTNVVARDVRHALPAMYGAARAMKKEQLLMYACNAGMNWHHGNNALCFAAQMGHANVVKDLCALGVPLESRNPESRRTPLIIAAMDGHDRVVDILLACGAAADATDIHGMNALAYARQWLERGSMLFNTGLHDPELGMNWARCVRLLERAGMAAT